MCSHSRLYLGTGVEHWSLLSAALPPGLFLPHIERDIMFQGAYARLGHEPARIGALSAGKTAGFAMTLLATLECLLSCPKMPRYVRAFRVSLAVFLSFRDPSRRGT